MPIVNQVVAGSGGGSSVAEPYRQYSVNANGVLTNGGHLPDFSGIKTLGDSSTNTSYLFAYAFAGNNTVSGIISMPDLVEIRGTSSLAKTFYNANITGVYLPKLQIVSGSYGCDNTFTGANGLTEIDLPNLEMVTGNNGCLQTFASCPNITKLSMPKLKEITGTYGMRSFVSNNTSLPVVYFQSLDTVLAYGLMSFCSGCTALQSMWFYALTPTSFGGNTNQFNSLVSGCTNVTVHFPMAIQSTIGSWTSVTDGFNGTNTTVLFDLVTSLTGADGNTYTRSEKDSTSTATAWTYNDTLYYTSGVSNNDAGVNEPSVADTIYSDDACTQSVTTITAIA